ncbi:MAG: PH domain-containing protein [Candidatus Methanoperedens sp.]|nr:PH domain-containing protein [Candidatus Methanoperedens sp.]
MSRLELINEEKLLKQTRPHPMAFYHLYAIWIYLVAIGSLFILYLNDFINNPVSIRMFEGNLIVKENPMVYQLLWLLLLLLPSVKSRSLLMYAGYLVGMYLISLPVIGKSLVNPVTQYLLKDVMLEYVPGQKIYMIAWLLLIIVPGVIIALTKISLRWLLLFISIALSITYLKYTYSLDAFQINLLLVAMGITGIVGTEMWRRRHRYYITNIRIITEVMGKRRAIFYHRISDLMMETPLLGSIFRFGSIVPLTGSGIGVGMDMSLAGAGVGKNVKGKSIGIGFGGGKTVSTPRSRSSYVLFGIPNPEREYTRITEMMYEMSEAETLRKMLLKMEEMLSRDGEALSPNRM